MKVAVKECFIFSNFLQNEAIIIMSCGKENRGIQVLDILNKQNFTEHFFFIKLVQ